MFRINLTFLLTLFLLFFCGILSAQKPQPVYSFAKKQADISWYKEQKKLWASEVKQRPNEALSWYYLYRCYRNLSRLDTTDSRTLELKNKEIDSLIREMEKNIPQSYEFHLVKWLHGGQDKSLIHHLREAEKLGTNRYEHLESSIVDAELNGDLIKRQTFAAQLIGTPEYSPGLMYYAYNTLIGLQKNAIIITSGDNDTYPLWMWQAKGFRNDVLVINLFLFQDKKYRDRLLSQLKTRGWDYDLYDKNLNKEQLKEIENKFGNEIFLIISENKANRPLYFSITVHEHYLQSVSDGLYLCGLVYQYSNQSIDFLAELKKNIEKQYLLDYIMYPVYADFSEEKVATLNENYIVPLFKLWEHYVNSGESQKANELKPLLQFLLKRRPNEKEIIQKIGS